MDRRIKILIVLFLIGIMALASIFIFFKIQSAKEKKAFEERERERQEKIANDLEEIRSNEDIMKSLTIPESSRESSGISQTQESSTTITAPRSEDEAQVIQDVGANLSVPTKNTDPGEDDSREIMESDIMKSLTVPR